MFCQLTVVCVLLFLTTQAHSQGRCQERGRLGLQEEVAVASLSAGVGDDFRANLAQVETVFLDLVDLVDLHHTFQVQISKSGS